MMEAEANQGRRRGPAEGTAPAPSLTSGAELLDDLLKELNEEGLEKPSSTAAPEVPVERTSPTGEPPAPDPAASMSETPVHAAETSAPVSADVVELHRALDLANAEVGTIKAALLRQQRIETELRRELGEVRTKEQALRLQAEREGSRFLPAAPVAFLSSDGKMIVKKAFYALGRGEALESFLTALLAGWRASGGELEVHFDRDGFSLEVKNDPHGRSLRLLPSGVYLLRLSSFELAKLGDLPPLVRAQGGRGGAGAEGGKRAESGGAPGAGQP